MSAIDFNAAEIRQPRPDEMPALYQMLAEGFPVEDWLYPLVLQGRAHLYTTWPLVLFAGSQVAGSACRFDMNVWLDGRPVTLAGVAAVATPERFRRQGVARRLMTELMKIIDRDAAASVLFTGAPAVYESHGFRAVEQGYSTLSTAELPTLTGGLRYDEVRKLDSAALRRAAQVYDQSPNLDGKVVRDVRYWEFYQTMFNHADKLSLLFVRRQGADAGYARVEREADRILVSELQCGQHDMETARALLAAAARAASLAGQHTLTLAMPEQHILWRALDAWGVRAQPETGATREVFMVRGPLAAPPTPPLSRLRWSLADKF